jgi:cell fate (sporulation/competence/biofilm development) regulator YlbF (YheA/YmcA/DUF963 family)
MYEMISEKARDLGRQLSQTEEYRALQRSREAIDGDREIVTRLNRLLELEETVAQAVQRGEEPEESIREEYERVFSEVQASPVYQQLVAAQSNFDKILRRVNEEISRGMEAGAQSRIILPS